jgi:pimeloyl-ACP methyl ester carboxylesterase
MPKATVNGCEYNYEDRGSGEEVIFFGHGLLYNWHSWEHQIEHFANKGYRVIAVDWRGQGESDGSADPAAFTLYNLGDDAYALLQQLGIQKVHWVGLSMGGMVAMRLYPRHPEIFASLALLDTSASHDQEHLPQYTQMAEAYRAYGLIPQLAEGLHAVFYTAPFLQENPDAVAYWDNYWTNANRDFMYKAIMPVIDRDDVSETLNQIKVLTLVLCGDQDMSTPLKYSEDLHRRINHSKYVIIENAAHMSCVERPAEVAQALDEFISSVK